MKILLFTLLTVAVVDSRRSCIEEILANAHGNVSWQSLQPCKNATKYKRSGTWYRNCIDLKILDTPTTDTSIYLQGCKTPSSLKTEGFSRLSKLEEINGNASMIKRIREKAFKGLNKLKTVKLSYNIIEEIKGPLFGEENELTDLNLKGNKITKVDKTIFKDLSKLKKLDLNGNKINSIEDESFSDLGNLEYLRLESNKLTELHDKLFTGLKKIKNIYLRNNQISTVDKETFASLKNIQWIDISRNGLKKISSNAFGYDAKDDSRASLIILASHNKLTDLYGGSLCTGRSLVRFDASFNNISAYSDEIFKNLEKLEDVKLENNVISELNLVVFLGLIKLKRVMLDNNKISHLYTKYEKIEILPICATLEVLSLKNNSLVTVKVSWFKGFPNLKELRLDENKIVQFEVDYLLTLPEYSLFNLSNNKLKNIPSILFDISKYTLGRDYMVMNLKNNPIDCKKQNLCQMGKTYIDQFIIYDAATRSCLNEGNRTGCEFEWTKLCRRFEDGKKEDEYVFYQYCPMKYVLQKANYTGRLDLRKRGMTVINNTFFHSIRASDIDLSYNEISVIYNNSFDRLAWTLKLHLQHNKLKNIYSTTFIGLENLKVLDISHNEITSIHRLSFLELQKLETIYLQENKLPRICNSPRDLVRFNPNIIHFEIDDDNVYQYYYHNDDEEL